MPSGVRPTDGRWTMAIMIVTVAAYFLSGLAGPHVNYQGGFVAARAGNAFPFTAVPFILTPLTATLLHGGLLHLGFNMLMLVFCGRQVEPAVGGPALSLLYLIGAYGAAAAQYAVDPGSTGPVIGASGAVSALIAAYAMMFARRRVAAVGPLPRQLVRALSLAAAWIALQWLISVATSGDAVGVATAAHVGGFVVGSLLARPLLLWRYRNA